MRRAQSNELPQPNYLPIGTGYFGVIESDVVFAVSLVPQCVRSMLCMSVAMIDAPTSREENLLPVALFVEWMA